MYFHHPTLEPQDGRRSEKLTGPQCVPGCPTSDPAGGGGEWSGPALNASMSLTRFDVCLLLWADGSRETDQVTSPEVSQS